MNAERVRTSPHVWAIVLNWNGLADTLECVRSLAAVDYERLHVLVVDNGSREFDADAVADACERAEVIVNDTNLGYSGGNNVGIRHALERGADWVWVLNNDVVVDRDALAAMLDVAAERPRAAAIGGKVFNAAHPGTLWMTWGRVTWLQSLIALVGHQRPDGPAYEGCRRVAWLPGCSLLLRAEALREVGLFDEGFFAYHEDVDWAARARGAGWECWYTSCARVDHRVHASSGGQAEYGGFRKYLSARNSVLYARRHGSWPQRLLMAAAIFVTLPFQYARRLASGEAAGVTMKVRGWIDGLVGRAIPFEDLGLRERESQTP